MSRGPKKGIQSWHGLWLLCGQLRSNFASRNLAQTSLAFHSRRTFWEYKQSEQAAQTRAGNNANWASVASEAKKSQCAAAWMEPPTTNQRKSKLTRLITPVFAHCFKSGSGRHRLGKCCSVGLTREKKSIKGVKCLEIELSSDSWNLVMLEPAITALLACI